MPRVHDDDEPLAGMEITRPFRLSWEFVVQLFVLVVGITLAYGALTGRMAVIETKQEATQQSIKDLQDLKVQMAEIKVRLDLLLTNAARDQQQASPPR